MGRIVTAMILKLLRDQSEMRLLRISSCTAGISIGFALVAMGITWLVLAETSPLGEYFSYHVAVPNFVGKLLPLPYFGLMIVRPPYAIQEFVGLGLEFVQWLFVGYCIAILFCPKR